MSWLDEGVATWLVMGCCVWPFWLLGVGTAVLLVVGWSRRHRAPRGGGGR